MICPVCRIEMIAVERGGIELDHCISCHGLWFDGGEMDLFGEIAGVNVNTLELGDAVGRAKGRHCPRCDRTLDEITLGAVRIDRCPEGDGLWFDRGELGSLIDRAAGLSGGMVPMQKFLGEVFGSHETGSVKTEEELP